MDHMVRVCFVINCQNIFRSGCINVQFSQATVRVPTVPYPCENSEFWSF